MNLMYIFDPWSWHKVNTCVKPEEDEIIIGCILKRVVDAECSLYFSLHHRDLMFDVSIENSRTGDVVGRCCDKIFIDALIFAYAQFVVYQKERFGDDE